MEWLDVPDVHTGLRGSRNSYFGSPARLSLVEKHMTLTARSGESIFSIYSLVCVSMCVSLCFSIAICVRTCLSTVVGCQGHDKQESGLALT